MLPRATSSALYSASRPAPVIRTRVTSISLPPAAHALGFRRSPVRGGSTRPTTSKADEARTLRVFIDLTPPIY
jgi:hypothetical protein